jgi:hypothetical protein
MRAAGYGTLLTELKTLIHTAQYADLRAEFCKKRVLVAKPLAHAQVLSRIQMLGKSSAIGWRNRLDQKYTATRPLLITCQNKYFYS